MTVTYSLDVSTAKFAVFTRLLFRWRGSIYKLVFQELALFATLYYTIMLVHIHGLSAEQALSFTDICLYFREYLDLVPLTFVLGFYVSFVVTRWWDTYLHLPWIDGICMLVVSYVHGHDERGRTIRRSMARYANLMGVLCLRCVSASVKRRFPTLDHVVQAKLMTEAERVSFESVNRTYGEYFIPAVWFGNLVAQARREGRISDDVCMRHIMAELNKVRTWIATLVSYDWISVPLVYTQVVAIATYTFFIGCLFARQFLEGHDETFWVSRYFPMFTFVQFFFYMGWLKVAEVLINPLGEDDEDFEVNYVIDRNVAVGLAMVDDLYGVYPILERDGHWDDTDPLVPYTAASAGTCVEPFLGSAVDVPVPTASQEWIPFEGGEFQYGGRASPAPSVTPGMLGMFTRQISRLSQTRGTSKRIPRRNSRRRSVSTTELPRFGRTLPVDAVSMNSTITSTHSINNPSGEDQRMPTVCSSCGSSEKASNDAKLADSNEVLQKKNSLGSCSAPGQLEIPVPSPRPPFGRRGDIAGNPAATGNIAGEWDDTAQQADMLAVLEEVDEDEWARQAGEGCADDGNQDIDDWKASEVVEGKKGPTGSESGNASMKMEGKKTPDTFQEKGAVKDAT